MGTISPTVSSELCSAIYDVQDNLLLKGFLRKRSLFFQSGNAKLLTAEVGSRLINTRDAFGLCARGAGQFANDVFFIFRGTTGGNYGADVITDLRMGLTVCSSGSFVHSGFNQTFSSMIPDLARFMASQPNVKTIHCIGHSLGGAVATLAADWAAERYNTTIKLYTFGAPRVGFGSTGFASKLTTKLSPNNICRVYHDTDPVPMVPVFPYAHAPTKGMACCLRYGGLVIHFPAHLMDNYEKSVKGRSWADLRRPDVNFHTDIKQWLQGSADENPHTVTFWQKLNRATAFVAQLVLVRFAAPVMGGLTIADYLAMILIKGVALANDTTNWVFLLVRKMMRALGMAVVETVEELTEHLLRFVLRRIVQKIYHEVRKALERLE